MNVFVLSTGRCGSTTFIRACTHMTNYGAGHETRIACLGPDRLTYPPRHIEADNRLSWLLGRLDTAYGNSAFYVHLRRNRQAVARSFVRRAGRGILHAYTHGIHQAPANPPTTSQVPAAFDACLDYCDTVTANIDLFLRDKPSRMDFELERAAELFPEFWRRIGAEGDLAAALAEFDERHNATPDAPPPRPLVTRTAGKLRRVLSRLPVFLREA